MNIIDASTLLFGYFSKYDSFCLDDDAHLLRQEKLSESDKAAVLCSLDSLKESGILKTTTIKGRNYWVLFKPFNSVSQNVEISAPVASFVANLVNKILEVSGQSKVSNPSNIQERDIMILLEYITSTTENKPQEAKS